MNACANVAEGERWEANGESPRSDCDREMTGRARGTLHRLRCEADRSRVIRGIPKGIAPELDSRCTGCHRRWLIDLGHQLKPSFFASRQPGRPHRAREVGAAEGV